MISFVMHELDQGCFGLQDISLFDVPDTYIGDTYGREQLLIKYSMWCLS